MRYDRGRKNSPEQLISYRARRFVVEWKKTRENRIDSSPPRRQSDSRLKSFSFLHSHTCLSWTSAGRERERKKALAVCLVFCQPASLSAVISINLLSLSLFLSLSLTLSPSLSLTLPHLSLLSFSFSLFLSLSYSSPSLFTFFFFLPLSFALLLPLSLSFFSSHFLSFSIWSLFYALYISLTFFLLSLSLSLSFSFSLSLSLFISLSCFLCPSSSFLSPHLSFQKVSFTFLRLIPFANFSRVFCVCLESKFRLLGKRRQKKIPGNALAYLRRMETWQLTCCSISKINEQYLSCFK
jgi:hypothetical protein